MWRVKAALYYHKIMGSNRTATPVNGGGPVVDKGVDFANYFCTYAYLYHQKKMLSNRVRMDAYFNAVFENRLHFHGNVMCFLCSFTSLPLLICLLPIPFMFFCVFVTI